MVIDWEQVLEDQWGRALVHESGHALLAALKGIPCQEIYFHKGPNKFCTVIDLPSEDLYTDDHYLFLVAGGAAELITYNDQNESAADSDSTAFSNAGAPPLDKTLRDAETLLRQHAGKIRQLVFLQKVKCLAADFNLRKLPEVGMDGTDEKYAVLLSREQLEKTIRLPYWKVHGQPT